MSATVDSPLHILSRRPVAPTVHDSSVPFYRIPNRIWKSDCSRFSWMHQVSVLAVSPRAADREALHRIFSSSNWRLDTVDSIAAAIRHISENQTPVVLCAEDLPDGPWEKLFHLMHHSSAESQLVVISRSADDTAWGEVLSTGACDVLPVPLEASEVLRVIATAWRHWRDLVLRRSGEAGLAAHASGIPQSGFSS